MFGEDVRGAIGIIYPVIQENIEILKKRERPVYVKYLTHTKSKNPTRLRKGDFLLLYLSREDKTIRWYSEILSVSFKMPDDIIAHHLDRIQMHENEYMRYVQERRNKPLLFLELKRLVELERPYSVHYPITMAGRYVPNSEYRSIIGR
jgi:hypothetical protein